MAAASEAPSRERVGRGAALALLAIPAGAIVTGLVWKLGFVGSVGGVLTAPLAALLYARGSGGRVARAVPVVLAVTVVGVLVSFFTVVAIDLWASYAELAANMASVFGSRWGFVAGNLFYPTLLRQYPRTALFLAASGVLGAVFAVVRLVRLNRTAASAGTST